MAEEDTRGVGIARRAMAALVECPAIRGRVTAAVLPGRRLATVEVVTLPAAEDTSAAEVGAVTLAAEAVVIQVVEAEVTPAAVAMADTTKLRSAS